MSKSGKRHRKLKDRHFRNKAKRDQEHKRNQQRRRQCHPEQNRRGYRRTQA
jgi:hypothetical protein